MGSFVLNRWFAVWLGLPSVVLTAAQASALVSAYTRSAVGWTGFAELAYTHATAVESGNTIPADKCLSSSTPAPDEDVRDLKSALMLKSPADCVESPLSGSSGIRLLTARRHQSTRRVATTARMTAAPAVAAAVVGTSGLADGGGGGMTC